MQRRSVGQMMRQAGCLLADAVAIAEYHWLAALFASRSIDGSQSQAHPCTPVPCGLRDAVARRIHYLICNDPYRCKRLPIAPLRMPILEREQRTSSLTIASRHRLPHSGTEGATDLFVELSGTLRLVHIPGRQNARSAFSRCCMVIHWTATRITWRKTWISAETG